MKIAINLASQPFRRDRAMLVASGAVVVVLVFTLGLLWILARADDSQRAGLQQQVARLQAQVKKSAAEEAQMEAVLHKPENAIVMETSVFINDIIDHKSISWSRLLSDLEKTIPYDVKLTSLVPIVNAKHQVALDMMFATEKPEGVVKVLMALENSPVFGEVYNRSTQQPTQSEPFHRCRVTVNYAQRL